MVGILDYGLAKVADKMVKFVIAPAMNCSTTTSFAEEVKERSEGLTEAILKTVPSSDFKVSVHLQIELNSPFTLYSL